MVQDDVGEAGYPGQIPAQLPHPPIPAPPGVPHHRRRVTDHAIVDTQVGLVLQDGNSVLALIEFPDAASAQAFQTDPHLRETMAEAGVVGAPDISTWSEASGETY